MTTNKPSSSGTFSLELALPEFEARLFEGPSGSARMLQFHKQSGATVKYRGDGHILRLTGSKPEIEAAHLLVDSAIGHCIFSP